MTYITMNEVLKMTMGTDVMTFFTERWDGQSSSASDNSWEVTLSEILNWGDISNMGMASNFTLGKAMKKNFKDNALAGIGTIMAAKVAEKVLQKTGVFRTTNKLVRQAGLGQMVKV